MIAQNVISCVYSEKNDERSNEQHHNDQWSSSAARGKLWLQMRALKDEIRENGERI